MPQIKTGEDIEEYVHTKLLRSVEYAIGKIEDFESLTADERDVLKNVNEYKEQLLSTLEEFSNLSPSKIAKQKEVIESTVTMLKLMAKFLEYIANHEDIDSRQQLMESLGRYIKLANTKQYDDAIAIFHNIFSEQDWKMAQDYFSANPNEEFAGSQQYLMYSYVTAGDLILRRNDELGAGMFGRTKLGQTQDQTEELAIKRQKRPPNEKEEEWLPSIRREADINLDLDVAAAPLTERKNFDGSVYKVYQAMRYLGESLTTTLRKNPPSEEQQLDVAIDVCMSVLNMHNGNASKKGTCYAHRDIKPDNILIDQYGRVHLIDFGVTLGNDRHNLNAEHISKSGSPPYMPASFTKKTVFNVDYVLKNSIKTPSYFFDDKIATLRTLYHPLMPNSGILSKEVFEKLPKEIRQAMDTHNIHACITNDKQHSLTFITAALILHKYDKTCTKDDFRKLMSDPEQQEKLIEQHGNNQKLSQILNILRAMPTQLSHLERGIDTIVNVVSAVCIYVGQSIGAMLTSLASATDFKLFKQKASDVRESIIEKHGDALENAAEVPALSIKAGSQ